MICGSPLPNFPGSAKQEVFCEIGPCCTLSNMFSARKKNIFRKMVILVVMIFSKFNSAYYLILLVYSVNCRPHWKKGLRNVLRTIWVYETFTSLLVLHLLCNSFLNVLQKKGNFFFFYKSRNPFFKTFSSQNDPKN